MKLNVIFFIAAVCVVLCFFSCERITTEGDSEVPSTILDPGLCSAKLNIITRAGVDDGEANVITDGRIYIFNSVGKCVQLLSTNEESNQTTTYLSAGSYMLYAIGGDDLSRFILPTQEEVIPASVITLQEGKVMDDLMMANAEVELEDGEIVNQNLALKHKVICVDEVEIKQIPQTVSKVEVSLTPLYASVFLNGDYPPSPTESYKIALTKQNDGTTWKATPNQMLFPSKGNPTIKVSITTDEGVMSYSYNASEELPANHHITIVGTYKVAQGVSLTGVLTDAGWDENRTITFDFDEDSQDEPVAGQFYYDYYVVSVDEINRTAVLLSKVEVDYVAPADGAAQNLWLEAFVIPMSVLETPMGISGKWRLPTLAEAMLITKDPNAIYFGKDGLSITIFFLDGNILKWAEGQITDNDYTFKSGSSKFNSGIYLRPVIDVTY